MPGTTSYERPSRYGRITPQEHFGAKPDRRSPPEQLLWSRIEPLGFVCQYQQKGYILDFYHRGQRLAVEVDGKWHEQRRAYDLRRDERFADADIVTLRFPAWRVLYRLDEVVARITWALGERRQQKKVRQKAERRGGNGLNGDLMRTQYNVAKQVSDRVRAANANWQSPFDTSHRGEVKVLKAEEMTAP